MFPAAMITGLSSMGLFGGASSASSFLGNLGLVGASAGLNYLSGSASAADSYHYAKKLMQKQYEYNKKYATEGPSWNVEGYRNAGLNPLLVANAGGSDFSSSLPSTPDVNYGVPDLSSAVGYARLQQQKKYQAKQMESVDSSIGVNRAQEDLFRAQQIKALADAESVNITNAIENQRLDYIKRHPETYFMPSDSTGKALHLADGLFRGSSNPPPVVQPTSAHEVRRGVVYSKSTGAPVGIKPNKLPKGATRRERPEEFQQNYRRLLGMPY